MARRNKSIYATAIDNAEAQKVLSEEVKPTELLDQSLVEKKEFQDRIRPIQEFRSVPEQVTRSTYFYRNHYYTDRRNFPYEEWLRRVDFYFPNTHLGVVFIDIVKNDYERDQSAKKRPVIEKMTKALFLVLEHDDTLYDAGVALDAITKKEAVS